MANLKVSLTLKQYNSDEWAAQNPILLRGEPGYELDTKKLKIGNGIDSWDQISYVSIDGSQIDANEFLRIQDFRDVLDDELGTELKTLDGSTSLGYLVKPI